MIDISFLPRDSGIYCIKNTIDDKVYVGKSVNIRQRVSRHKSELSHGNHHNPHLQHAWDLYGADVFVAYALELCDKSDLEDKEIYHIQNLNATNHGYNLTDGGEGALGRVTSDITKDKIRDKQPDFHRGLSPRAHPVVLLNTKESFACVLDAAEKYNVAFSAICNCCRGETKSSGRLGKTFLVWAYQEDYERMTDSEIATKLSDGQIAKAGANNSRARRVILQNTGEVFGCMTEAGQAYNVHPVAMAHCCKQRRTYAGEHNGEKLIWKFYDKAVVA